MAARPVPTPKSHHRPNSTGFFSDLLTGRYVTVTNGRVNQVTQSEDITLSGSAITLGGGILFFFNETLAADLQLALSGGRFTDVKVGTVTFNNAEVDAQSTRFNIGVSWWP